MGPDWAETSWEDFKEQMEEERYSGHYGRYGMALEKRVEVLFEQEKFSYLERKAKREKTSVGKLIREAVDAVYITGRSTKRREAVAHLLSSEYDFGASWEELKEEMAAERYRAIIGGMTWR